MYELSPQDVDRISRDISRLEINFSHLADDLIDHVCCDVEYEMMKGLDFFEAYEKVKKKMGSLRRLTEIQEETLFAVDSKYRKMKNLMKISGIAGTIILAFASLFKIMHWPGAGIMMTLGTFILAFFFMPSSLVVVWKETRSRKRLLLFVSAFFTALFFLLAMLFKVQHWPGAGIAVTLAGIFATFFFFPSLLYKIWKDSESGSRKVIQMTSIAGAILFTAGFLFKVQHWPGATILIIGGLFIIVVLFFPLYTWTTWKKEPFIRSEFIFLVVGTIGIMIPAALISLSLQRNYDRGYFILQHQQDEVFKYMNERNIQYQSHLSDSAFFPVIREIHDRTRELIDLINRIEMDMIGESEGTSGILVRAIKQTSAGLQIQYELLKNPFHTASFHDFLSPGSESRRQLEEKLQNYTAFLKGVTREDGTTYLKNLSDASVFLPSQRNESTRISMMAGIHGLSLMKNTLLAMEHDAVRNLTEKNAK